MSDFEIAVVESRADFAALEAPWRALFEASGRPDQIFQRFEWLKLWADEFLAGATRLAIVVGRRGNRLILVWPLITTYSFGMKRLVFMGEPAGQYGDILIEDNDAHPAVLEAAWARLLALRPDIIHLRRVRATSPLFAFLKSRCRATAPAEAPFVDFAGAETFEAFEKRYSAKSRSGRRRLLRRLQEIGPVGRSWREAGEEARALTATAFALKRAQLAVRGRLAPTMRDPRMERLFVAAAAVRDVGAFACALVCKDETIGVAVSFAAKGEAFGHILAHDAAFEKQGVGVLLAEYAFRSAFEAGCRRFDMAPPADEYKMDWATGTVEVDDFAAPLTWRGGLYVRLWLGGGRAAAKALANRLPTWLIRAAARAGER